MRFLERLACQQIVVEESQLIEIAMKQVLESRQQQWGRVISMTEVSHATGVSRMTLYRLLHHTHYNLTIDTLDRLCEFFQCDVNEMLRFIPRTSAELVS